jgi:bifunctional DNase/RNase
MIEMLAARMGVDASTHNYVVILQERDGERVLPIWIGQPEAESIIVEMHHIARARPLTHDLCKNMIAALDAQLARVVITRLEERTYYAEMHFDRGGAEIRVDARPSDSIAIALRCHAPIFAEDDLVAAASNEWEPGEPLADPDVAELTAERLKAYLERLRPEDFGKFNP